MTRRVLSSERRGLRPLSLPVPSKKTSTLVLRQATTAKRVLRSARRGNVALAKTHFGR